MASRHYQWRKRAALGGALLLLGAASVACDVRGPAQQALDDATEGARHYADQTAQRLTDLLRSSRAPRTREQLDRLDAVAPDAAYPIVFSRNLEADGTVVLEVALHAIGRARYQEVKVRMCVRLAGPAARSATVEIADTPCAASLPKRNEGVGGEVTVVHY